MISHHLSEDSLLAYAAGSLPTSEEVVAATHLTLCPTCRAELALLEELGGALLDESVPDSIDVDALLVGTLEALDDPTMESKAPAVDADGVLPAPIAQFVGNYSTLPWVRILPGVEQVELPVVTDGMPLRIFRLKPGMRVPDHSHTGRETSVVLAGGFTDDGGHYGPGDVCERGEELHRQRIDKGEPCVVLVLADNPLVPRSLRGHIAQWIHKS